MQKYYTDLDDFEDDSRPPLIDWVGWFVPAVIVLGAAWLAGNLIFLVAVRVMEGRWIG